MERVMVGESGESCVGGEVFGGGEYLYYGFRWFEFVGVDFVCCGWVGI